MSDQSDIDAALHSGKQAAESLVTWQKGSEGHRSVRDRISTIDRGIAAMDRLSRNLREGRMHVVVPYDDSDQNPSPRAVNLQTAAPGYEICGDCHGNGTQMEMKCYGGEPCESATFCDTCGGEGQVEIDTPEAQFIRAASDAEDEPAVAAAAAAPEPVKTFEQMFDAYDAMVRQGGLTFEARMAMKGWMHVTFGAAADTATASSQ